VQEEILAEYADPNLRVYAVWFPMLWGDARWRWHGDVLSDARVTHFWDKQRVVGQWFAEHIEGYSDVVWDTYYLFGPDSQWADTPAPLLSSGATIYRTRQELERQLLPLLRSSSESNTKMRIGRGSNIAATGDVPKPKPYEQNLTRRKPHRFNGSDEVGLPAGLSGRAIQSS
jgi:hypothetical protein